jgi:hypothetical protein
MDEMIPPLSISISVTANCNYNQFRIDNLGTYGRRHWPSMKRVEYIASGVMWQLACLPDAGDQQYPMRLNIKLNQSLVEGCKYTEITTSGTPCRF